MFPTLALLALLAPQQPDATVPPATVHAKLTVDAIGVQVYKCAAQDAKFSWVFQEPEADLFDQTTHQPLGTHTAGPTWTLSDGSSVTGKITQQAHTGDPASIPWLLLQATSTGNTTGELANVTYVRRSDTQGGTSTTSACDAEHNGDTIKVPYKAVYTFYTAQ